MSVAKHEGPSLVPPASSFTRFSRYEIEQSIGGRFQQIVDRDPSRIAVKVAEGALTYGTLNKMANQVAHAVLSETGARNEPIAVLGGNDVATIAAIMAVFKAGKIYVPLESSFSEAWAKFILQDAKTRFVLAANRWQPLAERWLNSAQVLLNLESIGTGYRETDIESAVPPDALSQILYTSGTTGQPKGVVDTHRNMLHYVMRLGNASYVSPEDRMTLVRPPSTAGALSNLCLALLTGAAIFPLEFRHVGVAGMVDWLRRERITIFHANPAVFRNFARQLTGAEEFPDLRLVRLGSGQVFSEDVELFKRHFRGALLLHVLSSTETNTYRVHLLTKDSPVPEGALPVGYPVEDMEVSILDDGGKPVGINEVGEIAVRSAYMSPAYWSGSAPGNLIPLGTPEHDGRRTFRTGDLGRLQSDGCLAYEGRKDFRLKIRGHRVQAEEVESALLRIPGISHAVVMARKDIHGDERLVAYVTASGSAIPTVTQIRESLMRWIPEYMIPGSFVFLDRLPLTTSGKVNRQELNMPAVDRPNLAIPFAAPVTPIERVLTKIWSEALGIAGVGIHDLFVDLGGDSIIAARIVSLMARVFPWELTLSEFYEGATVARIAQVLVKKASSADRAERVASLFLEVESMSAAEVEAMLAEARNKRHP
jgi:acyl-CoA synthetase (AMP-forming)/AMP-acid ligase II